MIDLKDGLLRFFKGVLIGTGFLLPGVSGGVLAAVFGLYERMISFLAHITRDFKKNLIFFLPVGVGACVGIVLLSFVLSYFLEQYQTQILWFFVGGILGTLPSLWKQAGQKGRSGFHIGLMAAFAVVGYFFLRYAASLISGELPQTFLTWVLSGVLIGLGMLVPGLSPSNFLVYLGLYKPMVDGFKTLDFGVIIPLAIGGAICLLLFSKVMDFLFEKFYAGLFHVILGIVIASTIMIVPLGVSYHFSLVLICAASCAGGGAIGYWMGAMDQK